MRSTDFLNAVKRAITVPAYQARFSDSDILALGNEEQRSYLVPFLVSLRENYFVTHEDEEITDNTNSVAIPSRAAGRTVRDLQFKFSSEDFFKPLEYYPIEKSWRYSESNTGRPLYFYFLSDSIILMPTLNADGTVRKFYEQFPSPLVIDSDAGTITAVGTTSITVDTLPDTLTVGTVCDITSARAGFQITYKDLTISNITDRTITFSDFSVSNPIADVQVNDVVTVAETSAVLQMPLEASDLLVQSTAVRILEARNVPDQIEAAKKILQRKEQLVAMLMTPRNRGSNKVINGNNVQLGNYRRWLFLSQPSGPF